MNPSFRFWWSIISWKSVLTTGHCIKLFSSVFRHEILSNFLQHSGILHPYNIYSIYLVVKASQFVFHIAAMQGYLRWIVILQRNFCLDFTESNWLSHHHIRFPWSIVKGFTLFTRFCDCSVKIELICRNNFAKTVSIVSWSAAKWIDSFPCPLLLRSHLDNGVVTRKIGHPLSANSTSIFSSIMSYILCGLFSTTENHFFLGT